MIIVQDKFVFLSNPRTGSRAFTRGLVAAGAVPPDTQHEHTDPFEWAVSKYANLPAYTILRNPIDWALSYWGMSGKKSFDEWIEKPLKILPWAENKLNAYSGWATHYMLYEWGHESMFAYLGIEPPVIPLIGSSKERRGYLEVTPERVKKIVNKFKDDVAEYLYLKKTMIAPKYIPPGEGRETINSLILGAEMG